MRNPTDLRETIISKADELFREHGYAATSIKQIAKASGCTTAALYYYFENGKSQILREVALSVSSDVVRVFESVTEPKNLEELLEQLGAAVARTMPDMLKRVNWVASEMGRLDEEERMHVSLQHAKLQGTIRKQLARFIEDEAESNELAWLIFCAYSGYGHFFLLMRGREYAEFPLEQLGQTLARVISRSRR
ncbi:MAG: TetR/AcrR family transcriptional regulator [Chloroflexi bacterium AL-W]|nr:TetR/AcrR family transcriptional regulator [Chloroflexi bacterium AL-N1]NOK65929.1 TetR/AcrR family transcriptional regulator [Chloroflexi bacterium AL-N10]NOK72810.1 TetR/AcrR family transcriptional regulator [Chloroflexi bacterium AL-N5]NOK79707.1 TetR/AcrR family transcriptional regulator [Chloroflexi bacterium AL-W]NOK93032.1 TetR/AcrR family transcriptional regulator [Chloroflexi bacterium AL-N15]